MGNDKELMYDKFLELQQQENLKNQKKIRVGLKINILLPLIFLAICFISDRSKLVFLLLWIISLFGIAFYLLYVEYMDFKLQAQLKEFGIIKNSFGSILGIFAGADLKQIYPDSGKFVQELSGLTFIEGEKIVDFFSVLKDGSVNILGGIGLFLVACVSVIFLMTVIFALWIIANAIFSACLDAEEMARILLYDQENVVRILTTTFFLPAWLFKAFRIVVNWVIK